jgi:hypothetical protein
MTVQQNSRRTKSPRKSKSERTVTDKKMEKTGSKSVKPKHDTKKALISARSSPTKMHQPSSAATEVTLAKNQDNLPVALSSADHEYQPQVKRVSFVIRLTLDEQSQFGRTEIQHASSGRKETFLTFDSEGLIGFMKSCINELIGSKSTIPFVQPAEVTKVTTPQEIKSEFNLVISDMLLFGSKTPDTIGMTLMSEEPFTVQVCFQLQGPDAYSFAAQEFLYDLKVYIKEIISGKSEPSITYQSKLIQNKLDYTVRTKVSGLSHGLYRLSGVVTLAADSKVASYRDGLIIQVI